MCLVFGVCARMPENWFLEWLNYTYIHSILYIIHTYTYLHTLWVNILPLSTNNTNPTESNPDI